MEIYILRMEALLKWEATFDDRKIHKKSNDTTVREAKSYVILKV